MRVKPDRGGSNAGGCAPPTSSAKRWGAIARRSAILLSGTAAIALSIAQPANAIVINDLVVPTLDAASGYYDSTNKFPNVAAPLVGSGTFCTGSLINSRTILTAAHCFQSGLQIAGVSFNPIASSSDPNFRGITSFYRNTSFNAVTLSGDIAVISLSRPITAIQPVVLSGRRPVARNAPVCCGLWGLRHRVGLLQ
jgi:trypsin